MKNIDLGDEEQSLHIDEYADEVKLELCLKTGSSQQYIPKHLWNELKAALIDEHDSERKANIVAYQQQFRSLSEKYRGKK